MINHRTQIVSENEMKQNLMKEVLYVTFFLLLLPCVCLAQKNSVACQKKEKSIASLNLAKNSLQTVKELYPNCNDDDIISITTQSRTKQKVFGYLDVAMDLVNDVLENYLTCDGKTENEEMNHEPQKDLMPMDCSAILKNGYNKSGIQDIWLKNGTSRRRKIKVFCDMNTEGGGWTVIQRRGDYPVQEDFFRDWAAYKTGFGNITKDFWLGNDNIFALSNQFPYIIRFDLKDGNGAKGYAEYDSFKIDDEASKYLLHISGYQGDVGDGMKIHDGEKFSTKDNGNDESPDGNFCSKSWKGGWWYAFCYDANLNGLYHKGARGDSFTVTWIPWRGPNNLNFAEIKLRPYVSN